MIMKQTVEIPADRRLKIEAQPEIPDGKAILAFTPAPVIPVKAMPDNEKRLTPLSGLLLGIASQAGDMSLDELRAERLSKYLK
jgi:hypothetical protein